MPEPLQDSIMIRFMDGNDAVVKGAIDAGCDFFAGYPITPATSILIGMMRELPRAGGIAVQGEDEIASIGFCIGAVMTGRKALTATSGPGISLYSENIGLAIMGETPLVIVDVQRQGPATGSATMGAQGDVQFVRWVTSGGYPTIALAPTSAAECYSMTARAFELAERFRCPVFVMLDKEIALTRERVDFSAIPKPARVERKMAPEGGKFVPYAFSKPGDVAPMARFGGPHILRYTTSMHGRDAYLTKDRETIQSMMEHLEAKIMEAVDDIAIVEVDADPGAEVVLLSYGSSGRSVASAVKTARAQGKKATAVTVKTLWPFPDKAIIRACAGAKTVVVAEQNLGEYSREVRAALCGTEVRTARRMDGRLVPPSLVLETAGLK